MVVQCIIWWNPTLSLDGREFLQTDAKIGDDGKLHVTFRKSTSSRYAMSSRRYQGLGWLPSLTPMPSNITVAKIYSINPTPKDKESLETLFKSEKCIAKVTNVAHLRPYFPGG
eukprot:Gb_03018 [translate_table: standard]